MCCCYATLGGVTANDKMSPPAPYFTSYAMRLIVSAIPEAIAGISLLLLENLRCYGGTSGATSNDEAMALAFMGCGSGQYHSGN